MKEIDVICINWLKEKTIHTNTSHIGYKLNKSWDPALIDPIVTPIGLYYKGDLKIQHNWSQLKNYIVLGTYYITFTKTLTSEQRTFLLHLQDTVDIVEYVKKHYVYGGKNDFMVQKIPQVIQRILYLNIYDDRDKKLLNKLRVHYIVRHA